MRTENFNASLLDIVKVFLLLFSSFIVYTLFHIYLADKNIVVDGLSWIIYLPVIYYIYHNNESLSHQLLLPLHIRTLIVWSVFIIILSIINIMFANNFNLSDVLNRTAYDSNAMFIMTVISMSIIMPIIEEIFFRYYLYGKLKEHTNIYLAGVISIFFYTIAHGADFSNGNIILQGVAYTYIYQTTKSINNSIVIHAFYNSTWFLISLLK